MDEKEKKALKGLCNNVIFNLRIFVGPRSLEITYDKLKCEWEAERTPMEHLHVEVQHCAKDECAPFPKNTLSLNSTCPWLGSRFITIPPEEPCPYQGQLP